MSLLRRWFVPSAICTRRERSPIGSGLGIWSGREPQVHPEVVGSFV